MTRGDGRPQIGDAEFHARARLMRTQQYRAARCRVADRIRQQIAQRAAQQLRLGRHIPAAVASQRQPPLFGQAFKEIGQAQKLVLHGQGLLDEHHFILLRARQKQHAVDHARQPFQLFHIRRHQLFIFVRTAGAGQHDLALPQQIGDGRAKLMREVGGKLRQPRIAFLQPRQHGVQGPDQGQQFRRGIARLQLLLQLAGPHQGRMRGNIAQRPQSPQQHHAGQQGRHQRADGNRHDDLPAVGGKHGRAVAVDAGHGNVGHLRRVADAGAGRHDPGRIAVAAGPADDGAVRDGRIDGHGNSMRHRLAMRIDIDQTRAIGAHDAHQRVFLPAHGVAEILGPLADDVEGARIAQQLLDLPQFSQQQNVVAALDFRDE